MGFLTVGKPVWLSTAPAHRLARRAGLVLLLALTLVPFQSIFWTPHVSLAPKLGLVALVLLTAARPRDALLVVAALLPFGYLLTDPAGLAVAGAEALATVPASTGVLGRATSALTDVVLDQPHRFTEALVLAFLAGYLARATWRAGIAGAIPATVLVPALLFGAALLASCVVNHRVWLVWDVALPSGPRLVDFLVWGYHDALEPHRSAPADTFGSLYATVQTCAGLALLVATVALCRGDPAFVRRLARMFVAGVAGGAALTFVAMAMYTVSQPELVPVETSLGMRWTMFAGINTAAAMLAMTVPLAIACGCLPRANRAGWWSAAAVMVAALALNGTRSTILPAVLVAVGATLWVVRARGDRRLLAVAMAVVLIAGAGLVATTAVRYDDARAYFRTANHRLEHAGDAAGMWASRPVFGHGIDQYRVEARRLEAMRRPHNLYLLTFVEMGAAGGGLFLWLIASPLWLMWRGLRAPPHNGLLLAALAGVTAFLLGNLGRSALDHGTEVTAFPFWIVLGLGAALGIDRATADPSVADSESSEAAERDAEPAAEQADAPVPGAHPGAKPAAPAGATAPYAPWPGRLRAFAAVAVVVLAASIPWRIDRQVEAADIPARLHRLAQESGLGRIVYGLPDWETSQDTRFRWTRGTVRFFAHPGVTAVEIPVRAGSVAVTGPRRVDVRVDGRLAERLDLAEDGWLPVRIVLPRSGPDLRWRTVELAVTPTWIPRDVLPGSTDARELGVMIGERRWCYGPLTGDGTCPSGWLPDGS